jgi:hypothetical protein
VVDLLSVGQGKPDRQFAVRSAVAHRARFRRAVDGSQRLAFRIDDAVNDPG